MPLVDLSSGKIYGCKKNTYSWWHEKGHILFNNSERGIFQDYHKELFLKICIMLLIFNEVYENIPTKFLMVSLASISLYYYFYEECWCWRYAIIKMKEKEFNKKFKVNKKIKKR